MNIIKFKDTIRPGDGHFNQHLKGQYAYWVRMRYVIPLNLITTEEYMRIESDDTALKVIDPIYWDMSSSDDLLADVDQDETSKVNDLTTYLHHNRYVTDPDITTEEVKKFRSWLAGQILESRDCSWKEKRVFEYYKNNLHDDTCKWFAETATQLLGSTPTTTTTGVPCGCSSNTQLSPLQTKTFQLSQCDPLESYRESVRRVMKELFSSITFWQSLPDPLVKECKIYIDNIIRLGLRVGPKANAKFVDCCDKKSNTDLQPISWALEKIILTEIEGNRNRIVAGLVLLADLYEYLYW